MPDFWWNKSGGISADEMDQGLGRTATGSVFGSFWNEISGESQKMAFNQAEAEKARLFNSAEAQKQRDFEAYMSNTAHQRAVADMRAAGINPMMAAGDAAATPSGAAAAGPAAHSSAGGNGGILGLVAKAANIAIAKGLQAKFTNSALKAADNHELVAAKVRHMAAQEQAMSAEASRRADADEDLRWHRRMMQQKWKVDSDRSDEDSAWKNAYIRYKMRF